MHDILGIYEPGKHGQVAWYSGKHAAKDTQTFERAGQAIMRGLQALKADARQRGKRLKQVVAERFRRHE